MAQPERLSKLRPALVSWHPNRGSMACETHDTQISTVDAEGKCKIVNKFIDLGLLVEQVLVLIKDVAMNCQPVS